MQCVKVAVWGKQAEEFKFNLGNVLIISKIKISQFNGVSLSVQWETALMKVEDSWNHIEEANELRIWYSNREGISNILKRKLSFE
jgi:ssDNA-binding replication factor A large subunit